MKKLIILGFLSLGIVFLSGCGLVTSQKSKIETSIKTNDNGESEIMQNWKIDKNVIELQSPLFKITFRDGYEINQNKNGDPAAFLSFSTYGTKGLPMINNVAFYSENSVKKNNLESENCNSAQYICSPSSITTEDIIKEKTILDKKEGDQETIYRNFGGFNFLIREHCNGPAETSIDRQYITYKNDTRIMFSMNSLCELPDQLDKNKCKLTDQTEKKLDEIFQSDFKTIELFQ